MEIIIPFIIALVAYNLAASRAYSAKWSIKSIEKNIDINNRKIEILKTYMKMDEKLENLILSDLREMRVDINNLKIEVAKIKTQAAIYAGLVFFVMSTIKDIVLPFIQK